MHILVAEDEVLTALDLQDFLEGYGFEVSVAANGAEAYAVWRCLRPDLVLTDCRMPVMDGAELVRCIRRDDPQAGIVMISGNLDFPDCTALPPDIPRLSKPVDYRALARLLEARLARPAAAAPLHLQMA